MKKNQLIQILQGIKGNPEVMIWNGLVNDVMPIGDVSEDTLYKLSKEHIYETLEFDQKRFAKSFDDLPQDVKQRLKERAEEITKKAQYEYPNQYLHPSEYPCWYNKRVKKIAVISAKVTGKVHEDRWGTITY
ncbi:MAG: hypothetical protein ACRCVU_06640 [Flavobacterium sp.]